MQSLTSTRTFVGCLVLWVWSALTLWATPTLAVQGRLVEEVLHSQALEGNLLGDSPDRSVVVYLPPSYDGSPDQRYPVLYLLHGWTMQSLDWIGKASNGWGSLFDITAALDRFMGANPTRELIVVMPDAYNRYGGSWYSNSPVTGNWEDFLTQDLRSHIDGTYRTLSEPLWRGVAGYSMGGNGAWKLALRHPGLYAALYDLDGGMVVGRTGDFSDKTAWRAILTGAADAADYWLALGTAAAFSPNPGTPPFYVDAPYELVGDSLVFLDAVYQRWVREYDTVDMVHRHGSSLHSLQAMRFGYSAGEGPASARAISRALAAAGTAHYMESYPGNHTDDLPGRVETRLLPFMGRVLHGELPQIQAAPVDLGTIVAGQAIPDISVVVARPIAATGAYPSLVADLSSLGTVDPVPLQHDGQGRYAARGNPVVSRSGLYAPLLSLSEEGGALFPVSVLNLTVWPAGDLPLLMDGLAAGWKMQGQLKVTLDPQSTAQTYEGHSALAAQTAGLWQVTFSPVQTISPLGYTLHVAFHPGDASGDALDLVIGTKRVNLWPGKAGAALVDLAAKVWQVVEVPLAEMDPYQPIKTISLSGKLTGTLYLDDLRLVAGPVPSPPQTAVLEERSGARPQAFSLAQNYPNPFNSGTVIPFSLPSATQVETVVYDLAGQRVATLVHGLRQAGTYAVTWDGCDDQGRSLASGVYLYQLTAGGQQATRKLVMVR